ncbi:exosortase C-terminal domain/associated protein EpsI [Aquabacterium sp.]|uniref:exosortase C-terminal domain/associated protein EpsI n=1 Tax=Aquabacterium sp. TaxID=1872578 RepID=UPI00248774B3|nr:exosortase C-terminal domain/associated protein EpsI [Aquabacterium sp.]MDI1259299.1 EpsI family protein [Aquabacterium sp.]
MKSSSSTLVRSVIVSVILGASAVLAMVATPTVHEIQNASILESSVPRQIGPWRELPNPRVQVSLSTGETTYDQPYDQSVMRSYVDDTGHMIQVALAWGKRQRQEVKIHRPELCYPAQGFTVESLTDVTFPLSTPDGHPVTGKRLMAKDRNGNLEAVSYWIRLGGTYSGNAWETRLHILKEGMAGRITDGVLVRVSQRVVPGTNVDELFQRQEKFAAAMVSASPAEARTLLVR